MAATATEAKPTNGFILSADDEKVVTSHANAIFKAYSSVMDGLGKTSDPLHTVTSFFSPSGRLGGIDPPLAARTFMFFTRPKCFMEEQFNIENIPIFRHYAETPIGLMLLNLLNYDKAHKYKFRRDSNSKSVGMPLAQNGYDDLFNNPEAAKENAQANKDIAKFTGHLTNQIGTRRVPESLQVKSPFIPLLTNLADNSSGGQDMTLSTYTTQGDMHGHKLSYAKTAGPIFGPGTLSVTFKDIMYSPIILLFIFWVYYIHYYGTGQIVPRISDLATRRVDYTCGIYTFVLDRSMTYIERWVKYTGCFPMSAPFAQILHSNTIDPLSLQEVPITFQYSFQNPFDPLVISEMNNLVWDYITDSKGALKSLEARSYPDRFLAAKPEDMKGTIGTTGKIWRGNPFVLNKQLLFI